MKLCLLQLAVWQGADCVVAQFQLVHQLPDHFLVDVYASHHLLCGQLAAQYHQTLQLDTSDCSSAAQRCHASKLVL